MPVHLAHLLNSAPVSPPRSSAHHQNQQGPSASKLSDLLSPVLTQQVLCPSRSSINPGSDPQTQINTESDELSRFQPLQTVSHLVDPPVSLDLSTPVFDQKFSRPFKEPVYQRPIPVSSFSYVKNREFACGPRKFESLKAFQQARGNEHSQFDLNQGFHQAIFRDEGIDEGLDGLLYCLVDFLDHCSQDHQPGLLRRVNETRFITWRGILTKICAAVYEKNMNDSWEMDVMSFNGTIYIQDNMHSRKVTGSDPTSTYYGYSYESFITSPPGTFEPVDTNIQWVSVVKANLDGIRLILGGEVDCVTPEAFQKLKENLDPDRTKELDPQDFIEIKTSKVISTDKQRWTLYRHKMIKFWLQSFLLGTPLVHVGFRDQSGILRHSETYVTGEIPNIVKKQSTSASSRWSGSLCLRDGSNILKFISDHLMQHGKVKIYEDEFSSYFNSQEAKERHRDIEGNLQVKDLTPWKKWPVFRIRLIPHSKEGVGKIELRELDYENEILTQVQLNKGPLNYPGVESRKLTERIGFLPLHWIEHQIKNSIML